MVSLLLDGAVRCYQRPDDHFDLSTVPTIRDIVGSCQPSRKVLESSDPGRLRIVSGSNKHLDGYWPYDRACCDYVQAPDCIEVEDRSVSAAWL